MASGADRFACPHHSAHVEPCDAVGSNLDHRGKVVERRRDQLTDPLDRFGVGQNESRMRAQVLRMTERHGRHDAAGHRLIGGGDHVLVPEADDHRGPVEIGSPHQLEVIRQTAADARGITSSSVSIGASTISAR